MRDDHDGDAETFAQRPNEVVQPPRSGRIEPGGRLVEKEYVRIERQRSRQRRAFPHAAAQARRISIFIVGEADQRQLESR